MMEQADPLSSRAAIFNDALQYHGFMAGWSRVAGATFIDWLSPPADRTWLDIGCGSGAFTQLIDERCRPSMIAAIDPSVSQVAKARTLTMTAPLHLLAGNAEALPFRDEIVDIVVSALALNFIPSPSTAIGEMSRVARRNGVIAGYVWDLAARMSPTWPIAAALQEMKQPQRESVGREHTSRLALRALLEGAGLQDIDVFTFDVELGFSDFDTYWASQTPVFHPFGKLIAAMSEGDREQTRALVRSHLRIDRDGRVISTARANAFRSRNRA